MSSSLLVAAILGAVMVVMTLILAVVIFRGGPGKPPGA